MVEIKLEEDEVKFLRDFVKKGRKSARELTRARTLLLANQQRNDTELHIMTGSYITNCLTATLSFGVILLWDASTVTLGC